MPIRKPPIGIALRSDRLIIVSFGFRFFPGQEKEFAEPQGTARHRIDFAGQANVKFHRTLGMGKAFAQPTWSGEEINDWYSLCHMPPRGRVYEASLAPAQ